MREIAFETHKLGTVNVVLNNVRNLLFSYVVAHNVTEE